MLKLWKKGAVEFPTSYRVRLQVPQNTYGIYFADDIGGPFEVWINGTKITDLESIGDSKTLKVTDMGEEINALLGATNINRLLLLGFAVHDKRYVTGRPFVLELAGSLSTAKNIDIYFLQDTRGVPIPYVPLVKRLVATGKNADVEISMYGWRNFKIKVKDSANNSKNHELKVIRPGHSGYVLEGTTPFTYRTREIHKEAFKLDQIRYIVKNVPADHTIYLDRLEIFPIGKMPVRVGNQGSEYLPGSPSGGNDTVEVK